MKNKYEPQPYTSNIFKKIKDFFKKSFCKHEWEYLENEEWNPDIQFCAKCDKTIYDYEKLKL